MNCYNCGSRLTDNDFCTNCGADVSVFKKTIRYSNMYYNFALEKAQVRDLSGAVVCLRQSLKLNKNNIEARNLLGLVYFEQGETVSALSEWVISKNIQPKKNIADDYINAIQENPARLDTINQTIKKFNQALHYCHVNSQDLAIIQLKKVLSLNPKYLQAHQLLALLYMEAEEWEKARRELVKCSAIDTNNTTTMRYMKEVNAVLNLDDVKEGGKKRKEKVREEEENHSVLGMSNDAMLKPINMKEPTGFSTVINIAVGVLIGLAIAWFLILPARIQNANSVKQTEIDSYVTQLAERNQELKGLIEEKEDLQAKINELEFSLDGYDGTEEKIAAYEKLIYACYLYTSPNHDEIEVAKVLNEIDQSYYENGSETYKATYDGLLTLISTSVAQKSFDAGMAEYNAAKNGSGSYETAVAYFEQAFQYDPNNVEALYYSGLSYRRNKDYEKGIEAFAKVIDLFPDSDRVGKAEDYIAEMQKKLS